MEEGGSKQGQAPVDVIIPVFRDLAATRRCVASVLEHTAPEEARLIVVDDASPEPELSAWVRTQAEEGRLLLLRNEQNLGFAGAVNRAIALGGVADVVLLNSDTEVPPAWLSRLRRCAASGGKVATVTPFSNNATICSYPQFCEASPLPEGLTVHGLDALFARANAGARCEIPTSVGFCVWIARDALEALGALDATAFARGYGEENEFSRRAADAGWCNLLCADLFVYHAGARSFGNERHELMRQGSERLAEHFPDYAEIVGRFIAEDPLRPFRDAVDALRLEQPGQAAVVLAEHRQARDRLQRKAVEALDRDMMIGRLGAEIDSLRDALGAHEAQLAAYQARCAAYEERCAAYDERCAAYDERCEVYERLLDETRAAVAERDTALAGLEARFRATDEDKVRLDEALAAARAELEVVYKSRYWRFARWLRKWTR